MAYRPEITVLGFVVQDDQVLMVHRISRSDDEQLGKWNGLGGKVEADEDIWSAMARELREEANLEIDQMRLRGTVSWPGFHADGTGVLGFIFLIDGWHGQIPERNAEGPLSWQPIAELGSLNMWAGDRYFIEHVFNPKVEQFHLVIAYQDYEPLGCTGVVR